MIVVNVRDDGRFAVIDGQHRLAALRIVRGDNEQVPCVIYWGLSQPEEAALFDAFNRKRKKLSHYETFRARLVAGDPAAIEIDQIITQLGLSLAAPRGDKRSIVAIAAVEYIYTVAGASALSDVLELIRDTWGLPGTTHLAYSASMLRGVYRFLWEYRQRYASAEFIARMSRVEPVVIDRRARALMANVSSGDIAFTIAVVLRELYNARRRTHALPPVEIRRGVVGAVRRVQWHEA